MSDNQLIAVRLLINKAEQQLSRTGTEKAFAVLHLHDALDWTMQYLYQSAERKKSEMSFKNFVKYIGDNERKFGAIDKVKAHELDEMRNSFKHSFVTPNSDRLKYLSTWCKEQINSFLQSYKKKSLKDYGIISTINIPGVTDEIKKAHKAHGDHKVQESVHHIAIAFDMITRAVEQSIEEASGDKPAISADFTFSNSFFMHIKELGELIGKGYELERSWDNVIQSITHLNKAALINMLGLDMHDYYRFQRWTPRPSRSLGGQYHSDIMPKLQKELPNVDYVFCEDFVIQAAINAESIIAVENNESTKGN